MGVHEELRRLDEDLAAGRLDAESYRRRRDTLLAARPVPARPSMASGFPAQVPSPSTDPHAPGPTGPETTGGHTAGDPAPEGVARGAGPGLGVPHAARSRSTPSEIAAGGAGRTDPDSSTAPVTAGTAEPGVEGTGDDRARWMAEALQGGRRGPRPLAPLPPLPPRPPPPRRPEPVGPEPARLAEPPQPTGPAPGDADHETGPPSADPFPPPFRWNDDPDVRGADATQIVGPDGARVAAVADPVVGSLVRGLDDPLGTPPGTLPADATQVVPDQGTPPPQGPAAGRTQIVDRSRFARPAPPPRGLGPGAEGPLAPAPPPERTQVVPGSAVARTGDRRPVPASDTRPPWVPTGPTSPPAGERMAGRDLFAHGAGPSAAAVAGTLAVLGLVAVVLVLSFLLA